jgi:glycosyltransferase involved in cell wall biosynthesis
MAAVTFSVIIPAYNAQAYIGEALESALIQKGVTPEIIVVDDGSTDATREIVKGFQGDIKILSQRNSGSSSARNRGVNTASGSMIAFLDADDVWLPDKLMIQKRKIEQGFELVYTNRINIGAKGDLPEIQSDIETMPEGDIFNELLYGNVITNSSVVISKKRFDELGGFRAEILDCEDWDLWLRFAATHPVGYCSEPLVKYRVHSNNKAKAYRRQNSSRINIITSILEADRCRNLPDREKRQILSATFATCAWATARNGDLRCALSLYLKALLQCPFQGRTWYDVARAVTGRI